MAHDEKVPRASEASGVPLRTFRRRRRRKLESGTKFRRFLRSIFLHALIYSLVYTVLWKCPRHPESSELCPIVNKITEPLVPYYDTKIAPYVEPTLERIQQGYETYAEPVIERAASAAKSQYNLYAAPYVTNVESAIKDQYDEKARVHVEKLIGLARDVYDDSLMPLWESSQPYITQALRRANAVAVYSKHVIRRKAAPVVDKMAAKGSELAKVSWAKVVKFYNDVIVVKSLQLYFDHVELAVLRVKDRIFLKAVSEDEYVCECDDYEEGDVENEEDIGSVVTSTITRTISRTAVSSIGSVYPGNTGMQTPEITPPVEHIDPEVAEHQLEIEKDIISWTSKFRTAGKNAVSSFSMEIDSLFQSAEDTLLTEAQANLLRAQNEIESIFDTADAAQVPAIMTILTAKADAVRAQAVEAASSVLRDAESIRSSTLDIFKTVTDIGLQDLGRKWAFMEGITWQDWKEYRTLKSMTDDFAQVIVDIPIDDKVVLKFLSDFDEAVTKWIAHTEAMARNLLEEAALTKADEEVAADQLNESAVEDDHLAATEEIVQTGDTELSSTILVSSRSVPDVSGTGASASIASTLTTSSSSANTSTSTLLTSTSTAYALSRDEL
ncbi:hypothetical protein V1508DRAFT_432473 [Lipomyces doorenjongii]|uniref:uncharacterized protein n=1 Tax=Lipomyces doorenjongii TaxID=383834 RepID=UPI0034CDF97C